MDEKDIVITDKKESSLYSSSQITDENVKTISPQRHEKIKFSVKFKIALLTALLIVIVTLSMGFYLLNNIKSNLLNEMKLRALLFTETLAQGIAEIFYDDTSRHEIIQKNKQTLKDIEQIYVINLQKELMDSTDEKTFQKVIQSKFDDSIDKIYIELSDKVITYLKNKPIYEKSYTENEEEKISFVAPVKIINSLLGYVKINFTKKYMYEKIKSVQFKIIIFVIIALLIGILLSYLLSSHIIKPIYKLSEGVHIIGSGNLNYKINIHTNDELKFLADEFNNMTEKLNHAQKSLIEKERFEEQLEIARKIQENLLPKKFPALEEIEISSYYNAAKTVGGDYYDIVYQKDNNKISAIIADVSGKGVPAALIMVMIRTVLHSTLNFIKSANEVIQNINTGITGKLTGDRFATIFYFDYDLNTGRIEYSNAAHSPLIIYKNKLKRILEFDTEGVPIGIEETSQFGVNTTYVDEGDILITFTDGITEAMNKNNEMFHLKRLKEIIKQNHTLSADELKNKIIKEITDFVGNAPQHDDMTLVVFKIKKTRKDHMEK